MPSHRTAEACVCFLSHHSRNSGNDPYIMWRGNRLVDSLAKQAAALHRPPLSVIKAFEDTARTVRFALAKLGAVTLAANECATFVTAEDGTVSCHSARDSQA